MESPKRTLVIGEQLYIRDAGNRARRSINSGRMGTVVSIARKFFVIEFDGTEIKCHIDSWNEKTNYTSNWKLYETETEWHEEYYANYYTRQLRESLTGHMASSQFTVDQLTKAAEILGITLEE